MLESKVKDHIGAKQIVGDPKIAKVSIVGIGMRSHVGIASLMFRTLAEEGINMQMISTSEIKISVVVEDKYMELAVRAAQGVRLGAGCCLADERMASRAACVHGTAGPAGPAAGSCAAAFRLNTSVQSPAIRWCFWPAWWQRSQRWCWG